MPTQLEYNLSKQPMRLNRIKVKLLNHEFQVVGDLTGDLVETPSFTIDSNSDIRRTCSIIITPTDSSFDIKKGNKIWLDKYVQIFIQQFDVWGNEYETNMGIYLITNPQRLYSLTDNTITMQCVDLMAKLTGLRNGNLEGLPYFIPQGSNVRSAMIALLDICGFTKYVIDECPIDVPNDIKQKVGSTAYQILTALRDIYPNYQIYFDVDGVFHYHPIPSGANEQVMVDDDIWDVNLLNYQKNTNFDSLKNSIEVFGKTHDIKNYGGQAEIVENVYKIKIDGIRELRKNTKIGFNTNVDLGENKLLQVTTEKTKVNDKTGEVTVETDVQTYPIKTERGVVPTFKEEDTYYVVKFMYGHDQWEFIKNDTEATDIKVATITSDDTYTVRDDSVIKYYNDMEITFRTPKEGCEKIYTPYLKINTLSAIPIHNTVKLRNDTVYTLKFNEASEDETTRYFQFLGEVTPYAKIQEENEDSPFYVGGTVGVINQVLSGGDYDNIYSSDLAMERAKWELYTRCRLQDSVTINCIPIYWLDVNWLVSITLPNKYGEEETELYMIKSINIGSGIGATMAVNMMKYYPYYDE